MWELLKKIYNFTMSIILYSVFFILVILGICVTLYFIDQYKSVRSGVKRPPLFGAYVIVSPSMIPAINVNDAVITMRKSVDKIKKSDVITFTSKDHGKETIKITHRVVGVFNNKDGSTSYRTKGDNNNVEDSNLVKYQDVLGKAILVIPLIGYLQSFLTTKIGWLIVIVIPCVLIVGSDILKLIKRLKNDDDDDDDIPKIIKEDLNEPKIIKEEWEKI